MCWDARALTSRSSMALVDVSLPGASGLELARAAAARYPEVRIPMMSAYDDYAYVTEALEAGVGGYLLKTASARELVDAVRAVADGVFVLGKALSGHLVRQWQNGPAELQQGARALTPRETDVVALLARCLSNRQMATELGISLRTVEGHVPAMLAKARRNIAHRGGPLRSRPPPRRPIQP